MKWRLCCLDALSAEDVAATFELPWRAPGEFSPDGGPAVKRWWGNPDIGNFDNIGYAMLTLFEMSTLEMWPDVMFRAMDADCEGCPMRQDANPWMALYMISWVILSAFFLLMTALAECGRCQASTSSCSPWRTALEKMIFCCF